MKIVIVGTFPPFRGGISNFYQTLYENLSYGHDVTAINFSLQYPSMLFPGKSQFDNNQKSDLNIERIINSINPISWHKAAKRIIELKPDIVIFKYWMPFFAPSFGSIIRLIKKKINIKSLVICDNIIPHESRFFDNRLTKYFF
ncbi:MAG: glycosyl transferase, partial [Candidatus Neomarinimicrobiota bacterium]|nr:glycosyl transferase [Candidatus Neomarinimicrobiota bacterium]